MKFSKALEGFRLTSLANGISPNSLRGYSWTFKKFSDFFDDPELESLTVIDLRRFFLHLSTETKLSPRSIQKVWATIRSFYNWASDELEINRPDLKIPMPKGDSKVTVPFTEDEVKKLLNCCELTRVANTDGRKPFSMKRITGVRDRATVLFLLDTGLRVSEFARLRIGDVNLETGEVIIRPYLKGRKSKSRVVFISNKTRKVLWKYLTEREFTEDDFLFVTRDNKPVNKDNIRQMLSKLGDRAGVKKVYPHKFRHTFAIQFLRNGGNVFELQRLLGHSTLDMVKRYLCLAQVDLKRAHKRASPVDNWNL